MRTDVLTIRACELAALAGMHKYRHQNDAIEELRARVVNPSSVKRVRAAQAMESIASEDVLEAAVALNAVPESLHKQQRLIDAEVDAAHTSLRAARDQREVQSCQEHVRHVVAESRRRHADALKECISDVQLSVLKCVEARANRAAQGGGGVVEGDEDVSSTVPVAIGRVADQYERMARGTVEESHILKRTREHDPCFEQVTGDVPSRTITVGETADGVCVRLKGICDAMECDGRFVVEIKRRQSRLFHHVPLYERVQVEAYMQLYDIQRACLVEAHGDDELDVHWMDRDDELWERICTRALSACGDAVE